MYNLGPHWFGGGAAITDNKHGHLDLAHAGYEDIKEKIWDRQGKLGIKLLALGNIVDELHGFCQETRNVHKAVKDWAQSTKLSLVDAAQELDHLRDECLRNESEVKKLRRLVVGHDEVSLQLVEGSFALAPARASSPVNRKGIEAGPTELDPQPATRNRARSYRKKAKMKKKSLLPTRQQGVVISGAGSVSSYAEVTRKLKDGVDLDSLGVKVTEMKYMRSGAITMTVGKGAEAALAADKLRVAVVRSPL